MHVRPLLGAVSGRPHLLAVPRAVLGATGFGAAVPFLVAGLAIALLFRREFISQIGPVAVQPPFAAAMVVPLLLALGTGVAHGTWPSAVIRRGIRTAVARASSYLLASLLSLAVVTIASAVGEATVGPGMLRSFLLLGGLTMGVGAICGIAFAWGPAVVLCCVAVLSPSSADPMSLSSMVFWGDATGAQLVVAGGVYLLGLGLAVVDVVSRGYVRSAR